MPDLRKIIKKYYPIIFLVIVIAVTVDMLGMIYKVVAPIIAGGEEGKIIEQLETAFPDTEWVRVDVEIDGDEYPVYVVAADDTIINFSFVGAGFGVWGEIRVLVSFNYEVALGEDFDRNEVVNEATVGLVYVTKQTETQGLGSRIATPEYTDQFTGLLVEEIWPQSKGGKIRTFTGATRSTEATIGIIRAAAEDKLAALPSAEVIEAAVLAKRETEK